MDLADTIVALRNQSIRLRIHLSEPREETLIQVGGFYKDTGGTWIYVTTDEKHFVKRKIKLGAKNPEYFTVLEGLQPGEKVVTSSYENFPDKDNLSRWEIGRKKPLMLM
jgi:HlyD family secretion protein